MNKGSSIWPPLGQHAHTKLKQGEAVGNIDEQQDEIVWTKGILKSKEKLLDEHIQESW